MDHTDADPRRRDGDGADLERPSSLRLPAGPVFLVGAARSGTSLLQRVLALHPDVTYLSNWNQRFPRVPQLTALNSIARWAPRSRSVTWFGAQGDTAYVYGRKRRLFERMFPNPAEAETFYARCGIPEIGLPRPSAMPTATAALQHAFRKAESWDGDRLMLTKRIANSRRIPLLNEIFPDSRYISIVRDGRAVALSLSTVDWWADSTIWWYGGTPTDWAAEGRHPWDALARNWVEEVRATRDGLRSVPESHVLSLSYESLISDPTRQLRAAIGFLGLDWDNPRWQTALSHIQFPDKNDRWTQEMPEDIAARVHAIQADELQRLGYAIPAQARGRAATTQPLAI